MDVIIKGKKEADAFGKYLTTKEGYELVSCGERNDYNLPDQLEVKGFPIICSSNILTCLLGNIQ